MKKCKKSNPKFIAGEAYLFRCRHNPTIIGIFDKYQEGRIYLESATYMSNYREFVLYKTLPPKYKFGERRIVQSYGIICIIWPYMKYIDEDYYNHL